MNTQTLEKFNKLSREIINLKRIIKGYEENIKDIKETGKFYVDEPVLVFERLLCTNEYPTVDEVYSALGLFKGLLENPQYYDGQSVYEGECLMVERKYIDSEVGEDCRVKFVEKEEPVAWEDYNEDNTYLQVWNECNPTEQQCLDEVKEKEEELTAMKKQVEAKEQEIKTLMSAFQGD